MKLVDRDQPIVKRLDPKLLDSETEGCMGANQNLVAAFEEGSYRLDLSTIRTRRVAEVPFRRDAPIGNLALVISQKQSTTNSMTI